MTPKPRYFTGRHVADHILTQTEACTFRDLVETLKNPVPLAVTHDEFWKMQKAEQAKTKMVPYLVACTFPASPHEARKVEFAEPCNLIFLDIDDHPETREMAKMFVSSPETLKSMLDGFNFAAYRTASYTPEKPRLRLVVDADGIPPARYADAVRTIASNLCLAHVTSESVLPTQPMFLPSIFADQDRIRDNPMIVSSFDGVPFTTKDISTDGTELPGTKSAGAGTITRTSGDLLDDLANASAPMSGIDEAEAVKMLSHLSPDCSRPEWIKVGSALHHQFGDAGEDIWIDWSRGSREKFVGEADCHTNWKVFRDTPMGRSPITLRTVAMKAKERGWKQPASSHTTDGTGSPLPSLPPIRCAADLIVEESAKPRPQQLVEGLLHVGEKLLLAGASKSYKSWALLDLACSVGTGAPFWGLPTTQGSVLLLNYEIRPWFFAKRLEQVAKAKGCGPLHNVHVWNLRGKRADFGLVLHKLRTLLKSKKFVLVIIDPLYSGLAGRSENDAAEMAAFMNSIEELTELGPAAALGHHFAKGNSAVRESLDRASGSGVFARDPDAIVTLNRHQTDEAFVAEFTLRNFKPLAPRGLKLNFPLLLPDASLDVEKIKGAQVRSKPAGTVESIVALLPKSGGMKTTELLKAAQEDTGVGPSRFYALLADAKKQRRIRNVDGLNEAVPIDSTGTPQVLQEYSEE
jgi:hypothetical protein